MYPSILYLVAYKSPLRDRKKYRKYSLPSMPGTYKSSWMKILFVSIACVLLEEKMLCPSLLEEEPRLLVLLAL